MMRSETTAAFVTSSSCGAAPAGRKQRIKIAAVVTTFFEWSHADVIVNKFVRGFPTDDGLLAPEVEVVSLYMDQRAKPGSGPCGTGDVGTALAQKFGIRICSSIVEALCLDTGSLAVDGVLCIGEHGTYPHNEVGQHMYPRRFFFEQICGVMASSGRVVPVFTDKHLAHSWEDASAIYARSQELGLAHMAGSSVPLYWRAYPPGAPTTPPSGALLREAVGLSYGGLEAYGYHGIEALQSMLEARPGGETGLASVQCIEGTDAVWVAGEAGLWSIELAAAAAAADRAAAAAQAPDRPAGEALRDGRVAPPPGEVQLATAEDSTALLGEGAAVILLVYSDGFRAALLHAGAGSAVSSWAFAGRRAAGVAGEAVEAFSWRSHDNDRAGEPFPHFSYLCLNIQQVINQHLLEVPQKHQEEEQEEHEHARCSCCQHSDVAVAVNRCSCRDSRSTHWSERWWPQAPSTRPCARRPAVVRWSRPRHWQRSAIRHRCKRRYAERGQGRPARAPGRLYRLTSARPPQICEHGPDVQWSEAFL